MFVGATLGNADWFLITVVCFIGAVSPGPSLALIIGNTVIQGKTYGVATAVGHAFGIGCWALLTAVGIAQMVAENTFFTSILQLTGVFLLAYVGIRMASSGGNDASRSVAGKRRDHKNIVKATIQGGLISLWNPKILVFFVAIFSNFVRPNAAWSEIILMGIVAGTMDALWYVTVALVFGLGGPMSLFMRKAKAIGRINGAILIGFAFYLLGDAVRGIL